MNNDEIRYYFLIAEARAALRKAREKASEAKMVVNRCNLLRVPWFNESHFRQCLANADTLLPGLQSIYAEPGQSCLAPEGLADGC